MGMMLRYLEQSVGEVNDLAHESDPARRIGRAKVIIAKLNAVEKELTDIRNNIDRVDIKKDILNRI